MRYVVQPLMIALLLTGTAAAHDFEDVDPRLGDNHARSHVGSILSIHGEDRSSIQITERSSIDNKSGLALYKWKATFGDAVWQGVAQVRFTRTDRGEPYPMQHTAEIVDRNATAKLYDNGYVTAKEVALEKVATTFKIPRTALLTAGESSYRSGLLFTFDVKEKRRFATDRKYKATVKVEGGGFKALASKR